MGTVIVFYTLASLSDYWDGKLSRRFEVTSEFGKFYDSLVDKVFVLGIFWFLFLLPLFNIYFLFLAIILLRDLVITWLRVVAIRKKRSMSTDFHGKAKTFLQMTAQSLIFLLLLLYSFFLEKVTIAQVSRGEMKEILVERGFGEIFVSVLDGMPNFLLMIVAVVTLYSGVVYLVKNRNILQ